MLEPSDKPIGPGTVVPSERRKVPNGEHIVLHHDQTSPNGRVFRSSTFATEVPSQPKILEGTRHTKTGYETMISVVVEPADAPIPHLGNTTQYESSLRYFNNTNRAITVTDKHNITFTLPKPRHWTINARESFVVRKTHCFGRAEVAMSVLQNHNEARTFLSVDDEELRQVIQKIEETRNSGAFRNVNSILEIHIDRIVPITLFNEYQAIYISDIDMLFREEGRDIGTPHPTSEDAILRGEVLKILDGQSISGVFYQIVDNENVFGVRYMNVGSQLMQIPTIKNPSKPSGIYHTFVENTRANTLSVALKQSPLTGGEELGIYKTRDEAVSCGNSTSVFELKLAEAKRSLKVQESENEQMKIDNDQLRAKLDNAHLSRVDESKVLHHEQEVIRLGREKELLESKHRLVVEELKSKHDILIQDLAAKLAHAQEATELERKKFEFVSSKLKTEEEFDRRSHVRSDIYEERSAARKDSSEVMKWLPTAVGAAIGIGGLIVARNNSEKSTIDGLVGLADIKGVSGSSKTSGIDMSTSIADDFSRLVDNFKLF